MTTPGDTQPLVRPETTSFLPEGAEIFSIVNQSGETESLRHVVVSGEEIGGTNALMPVIRELLARDISVTALLAGPGKRILKARGHEHGLQMSHVATWPERTSPTSPVVISPSEDGRLEEYLLRRHGSARTTVIEDFYESSRRSIEHARNLGLDPPTVCVIDPEAEELIRRRFPDVTVPVAITGTPTFDNLLGENALEAQRSMRERLGVTEKRLVALLIPRLGHTALASEIAEACRGLREDVVLALRPHPSDGIDKAIYEQMFSHLPCIDTNGYHTDEVATAADLVITQRSLTGLREVVRQRLTVTLNRFVAPGFTLPLADSGASLVAVPSELPQVIDELLEGKSDRCQELRDNMEPYKVDGKAAARVADVVCQAIR